VDRKKVFEPLKHCVNAALAKSEQSKWSEVPVREQEPQEISLVPEIPAAKTEQRRAAPRIKQEQPVQYTSESVAGIKSDKGCKASLPLQTAVSDNVAVFSVSDSEPVKSPPAQEEFWDKRFFSDLTVIGQLRNSYILCDSKEGLIIIDQHAAHERIVYESLKKRGVRKSSQALLMPETIELGYKESAAFVTILPELAELGLEIEPFGGTTFVIKSVPTLLSDQALHSLVTEIAEKMVDIEKSDAVEKAIDECLILMSCHGAIRAKAKLEGEQIRHLLKQLDEIDNSSCCPHGRPTWVKWSMGFIEKAFKRVV
jgi:DNA mismatch repair protein MutL